MYNSINDFMNQCILFSDSEKKEIIKEATDMEIDVLDYINFNVAEYKKLRALQNNQKSLVYDIEY